MNISKNSTPNNHQNSSNFTSDLNLKKNFESAKAKTAKETLNLIQTSMFGGDSSGGGQGIIYANKRVRFLDFVSEEDLPETIVSEKVYDKVMYPERYVRKLGQIANNFFKCSNEKLLNFKDEFPVMKDLIGILNNVNPIFIKIPLVNVSQEMANKITEIKLIKNIPFYTIPSPSALTDIQNPIAIYKYNRLWISEPLFNKMSTVDQCGLAVHESFRHMNYSKLLTQDLSTIEIEVLTRYVFGVNFKSDSEILEQALEKLSRSMSSSIDYREMSRKTQEEARIIKDYEYANWDKLTVSQRKKLDEKFWTLINQSDMYITQSVSATLGEIASTTSNLMLETESVQNWMLRDNGLIDIKTLQYQKTED